MKNTILEKFQNGEPCLGTFTHLLSNTGIRKTCAAAGKLCIVFCDSAEKANAYFRQGFANVTLSVDAFMLLNAVSGLVEEAKNQ